MKRRPYATALLCAMSAASLMGAVPLFAAEQPPAPSKETREKMAVMHEKMAACLRSDKAFAECRTQMQKECQAAMGGQGCMMMGQGMGMMNNRPQP